MHDPTLPNIINDVPRSIEGNSSRKPLTRAQLEQLLEGELDGDDHPLQPVRRNIQNRIDNLLAQEERTARAGAMTPQEIVDTIPRHF